MSRLRKISVDASGSSSRDLRDSSLPRGQALASDRGLALKGRTVPAQETAVPQELLRREVFEVLFWAGLAGFLLGIFQSTWQHAVEGGQVVAGIVKYPHDNPFYLYQQGTWTVLHQLTALGLRLGLSEIVLSMILSGVMGQLSFQALALTSFAVCRKKVFSILLPFYIYLSGAYHFGSVYIVLLMKAPTTYGITGLSLLLLTLALLSLGRWRAGGFFLALMPAVHGALGVLGAALAGIALGTDPGLRKNVFHNRSLKQGLLWGLAAAGLSFFVRGLLLGSHPGGGFFQPNPWLVSFIRFWDGHRIRVDPLSEDAFINLGMFLLCTVWRRFFVRDLPESAVRILAFFQAAALLGFGAAWLTHVPAEFQPTFLLSLMPARILSLNILAFLPVFAGIGVLRGYFSWVLIFLVFFLVTLKLGPVEGPFWVWRAMLAGSLVLIANRVAEEKNAGRWGGKIVSWVRRGSWVGLWVLAAACAGKTVWNVSKLGWEGGGLADNLDRDPLLARVSEAEGMLLTGYGMGTVQLMTRRPVLLDMASLDGLPYFPQSMERAEGILKAVYGLSFFEPLPEEAAEQGRLLWEARPESEWQALARRFGFRQILTAGGWRLQLPRVAENQNYVLYAIPGEFG